VRSLTGQEEATINALDGYSVRARVWVWNGTGWEDVTSLEDRDWLVEVSWDESIDDSCAQATVQLRRRQEDLSLNPLVSNKLTGVLALARPFYIQTATVPLGDAPQESDWRESFRGVIEELSLDKDPIAFTGRDGAGKLIRAYIETDHEYGSTGGVATQTIIQSILTDNSTGVTLYTPVSPGTVHGKFPQKKMFVLAAVRELALKIGWDARMWWDDGTGTFRFTLLKPDRLGTAGSQWSFRPGQVRAVTRMKQSIHDVRNAVRLEYYNRSVLDAGGKPTLDHVTAEDATSIATYERNFMRLSEDEDSPVDSAAEAQAMANAARDDLKDPLLDFGVEVGLHFAVQLRDLLTFEADDENFSSDQTLAVVSIAHRVGRRGHRTSLTLRGKPVGAHAAWLRREGRVVRQPPTAQPPTVTGVVATATTSGAVVTFAAPTVPPFPKEYELHKSTISGFTVSDATLYKRSAETTFDVTGLTPGVTYYFKVVPRDGVGNRGSASAQASLVPRYVEARYMQPRVTYSALPLNADFEAQNDTASPPDGWVMNSGSWTTALNATTDAYAGANAVVFYAGSGLAGIDSQLFAVRSGEEWVVSAWYKTAAANTRCGSLVISWLATPVSGVGSSTAALGGSGVAASTWTRAVLRASVPAGAKYAAVSVNRDYSDTNTLTVDSVDAMRMVSRGGWVAVTYQNGWTDWNAAVYYSPSYRVDDRGEVQLRGLARSSSPAPAATSAIFTLPAGCRPLLRLLYRANTGSGTTDIEIWPTGAVVLNSIAANSYVSLDWIRFQAEQ
jgi:hypothetical protein